MLDVSKFIINVVGLETKLDVNGNIMRIMPTYYSDYFPFSNQTSLSRYDLFDVTV